jgi:hypothetical protein
MRSEDGVVLIDGELNTHIGMPHEVDDGVKFFVLKHKKNRALHV